MKPRWSILKIVVLALVLTLSACGDDSDGSQDDTGPMNPNVQATPAIEATQGVDEPSDASPFEGDQVPDPTMSPGMESTPTE